MADTKRPENTNAWEDVTRRELIKLGAVTGAAAAVAARVAAGPSILKVRAASDQIKYGMVGTGSRGTYLLGHLKNIDNGHCVALCDLNQDALDNAAIQIGTNPKKYKDYRELLSDKDVEAVLIAVPLYVHFPITRDSLLAGKHVFCEKSLVFRPEEVHALRTLAADHPKQTLQVGLQRRYSKYYQWVKDMIAAGDLGTVTHIHAQWHRNPGWTMKDGGKNNPKNWRLFREYSGGLTAELASHQVDVANWFFGAHPEFVIGLGGLDTWRDGRDIFDNIQLIYSYPGGRKLIYSAITTSQHLPILNSRRPEFGEVIMGTAGAVEITLGSDNNLPTAAWFVEPAPTTISSGAQKTETKAGASFLQAGPQRALPIKTPDTDYMTLKSQPLLQREPKFAKLWMYEKGILTPEEDVNPVDTELTSFLNDARTGARAKADVEVGLGDSTAVMLSNIAMYENRRVDFSEIDKLGFDDVKAAMERQID
jgi:predicted dehydrogenase